MDQSQMRVRPGFLPGWLAILGVPGCLILSLSTRKANDKRKAMIVMTRSEENLLMDVLKEKPARVAVFAGVNGESAVHLLSLPPTYPYGFTKRTNALGEVIDVWRSPYRITLVGQTNFIIRSAGSNMHFGHSDDIVFHSVSNDFVRQ